HNRFELGTRAECRDRRRLDLHRLTGARVAGHAGCATTLFEDTETGNGHAVTLVYRTHNGVDDILDGGGRLPTVRAQFLCEHVYELCFVHPNPPKPVVPFWEPTSEHGKPSPSKLPRATRNFKTRRQEITNPLAALGR